MGNPEMLCTVESAHRFDPEKPYERPQVGTKQPPASMHALAAFAHPPPYPIKSNQVITEPLLPPWGYMIDCMREDDLPILVHMLKSPC